MPPFPTNDEFVGMTKYVTESFHDLLAEKSKLHSSSNSSKGSHHPSRECFMVGTPEGHVESIHEEKATPTNDHNEEAEGEIGPTSPMGGAAKGPAPRAQGCMTPARAGTCGA
jgi:hypothetical protein